MPILAGQKVLAADLVPPAATRCRAYSSAGVTATVNNTLTLVPLGGESYDTASMHSTVSNTSRIEAPADGVYLIIAQVGWATNTAGRRAISVRKNAAGVAGGGTQVMIGSFAATASSGAQYSLTDVLELVDGDYLELFGLHNIGGSPGTLDIASGESNTFMVMQLVATT